MLNHSIQKSLVRIWLAFFLLSNGAHASETWPEIQLPDFVDAFDIGSDISVNGIPIHVRGFVTDRPRGEVIGYFIKKLGNNIVESSVGDQFVIGRAQGHYYLTVQISGAGGRGARGVVAVADYKSATENMGRTKSRSAHWLANMPMDTRVLTQVQSQDQGRRSLYLVLANFQDPHVNENHIKQILQSDGYHFELEMSNGKMNDMAVGNGVGLSGNTLYFNGEGKQAMSVIYQKQNGQTVVVINLIDNLQGY